MDRTGFSRQDEEGSLKGILGIVPMAQDTATDAHDHLAMPVNECLKGIAVTMPDEPRKQFRVAQSTTIAQKRGPTDSIQKPIRHVVGPPYN
jgi:hypothetical protein